MKKLFHRKKHSEPEASPRHSSSYSGGSEPAFRTSLYDTTAASVLPQTGDYPIRGNDTSNALREKPSSRRSSIRSWRSAASSQQPVAFHRSPTPDRYATPPESSSPSNRDTMGSEAYAPRPAGQRRWSRTQLSQDFSNMALGHDTRPVTTTTTTSTTGPHTTIHISNSESNQTDVPPQRPLQAQPRRHGDPSSTTASIRPVNPIDGQSVHISPNSKYATNDEMQNQKADMERDRRTSIPRKQIGAGLSSSAGKVYDRDESAGIISSYPSDKSHVENEPPGTGPLTTTAPARSSESNSNRGIPGDQPVMDAQAVAERAQTSTEDTSVSQKYAPAVVHETVHQNVHHIREELIRREIHTHDIYHRILPVIDVEVLPPRHFLPVEGGGLVEVSADDIPSRTNNWVLAETISQIPSDQPAPCAPRNFTAREFPGREGDAVKYTTPEGYERTEQTWVHAPELETGARDTGQSWPMVFGGDAASEEGSHGYKSPKSSQKRSSKHVTAK